MNELAKVITSDLVAIIDGWRLKFLRLSDFSSVDVYDFPRGNLSFDDYFELFYDHKQQTFYAFAITSTQK